MSAWYGREVPGLLEGDGFGLKRSPVVRLRPCVELSRVPAPIQS